MIKSSFSPLKRFNIFQHLFDAARFPEFFPFFKMVMAIVGIRPDVMATGRVITELPVAGLAIADGIIAKRNSNASARAWIAELAPDEGP